MAEKTLISAEALAKHNTEKDCWIAMHNLVLKLPQDFLDEHPGGPDIITCLAGKDATSDFEDVAHSDSARDWANKFIIGYTEGADEETKSRMTIPKATELRNVGGGGGGGLVGGGTLNIGPDAPGCCCWGCC
mmetsp:Transcript_17962/g.54147  ORF Transcript_17962/g.54147 Transcript_17962/m.54147 type:complete len:132 (+) Transcript_17962:81-476(+)